MAKVFTSEYGREVMGLLGSVHPSPCLLLGPSGMGKSVITTELGNAFGQRVRRVNFHEGMDIGELYGINVPVSVDGNTVLTYRLGELALAARDGDIFVGEEINRMPQAGISGAFGLLDTMDRHLSLPEATDMEREMEVHPDFMFVASANPLGGGYNTHKLDKAFLRRFVLVINITEPLADEEKVLHSILPEPKWESFRGRLLKWARSITGDVYVSTGDLVNLASNVKAGIPIPKAMEYSILNKLDKESADGLAETFKIALDVDFNESLDKVGGGA